MNKDRRHGVLFPDVSNAERVFVQLLYNGCYVMYTGDVF